MADANIEVKITYEQNEIKKAISYYILRVYGIRTYAIIVYPILVAAVAFSLIFSEYALLSIVFILAGYILYYIYYQRPIDGYLKFYRKREGCIYGFSNDGVTVAGEEVQSQFLWSVFKKAYEIPVAFLLLDDNKFIYVFSKSCFRDNQSNDQMHKLLSEKFPNFREYRNR